MKKELRSFCKSIEKFLEQIVIGIILVPPFVGKDPVTGKYFGFDIDVITAIVKELGYKIIVFQEYNSAAQLLAAVKSAEVDLSGMSVISVTNSRLLDFSFVAVDGNKLLCGAMFFKNGVPSGVTTENVFDYLITNNIIIADQGPGSITRTTLLTNGVNPANLVDVSSFTSEQIINGFLNNQFGVYYSGFSQSEATLFINAAAASGLTLGMLCVNFDPALQVKATGYTFSKDSCILPVNVQREYDDLVEDGEYQKIINKWLKDPRFLPSDRAVLATIMTLPPLYSIKNRFISAACTDLYNRIVCKCKC